LTENRQELSVADLLLNPNPDVLPPVSTPRQVSDFVQTSVDSLAQDRYRGRGIPFVKIGGRVRYLREDVLNYLAANRMQRTDDPRGAGVA
jgi:hypothetical protein